MYMMLEKVMCSRRMVTSLWHQKLNEIFVTDKNILDGFKRMTTLNVCKIVELMKRAALLFIRNKFVVPRKSR